MQCKCGTEHNGLYGSRCEDCWAEAQNGAGGPHGIPYVSELGERRPRRTVLPNNPDLLALVSGGVLAVF